MSKNLGVFVSTYGAGEGQAQTDFFATVDQAMFVSNGGNINGWVGAAGENPTGRALKAETPAQAAEELYLGLLNRRPEETEVQAVAGYLQARPEEKQACLQEIAWALLNSAEFRFNH